MPRSRGPIWDHFNEGVKQNSSHYRALCRGCIEKNATASSVLGVEKSMVAHILKCPNTSDAAKELVRKLKQGAKENGPGNTKKQMREEDDEEENARKKRALHTNIPTEIKFLRQLNTPFTDVQAQGIRAQIEKATVSANLPGGWFENLEVIKLFKMIHETARNVTPSRQQVDGEVEEMNDEVNEVKAECFESWYRNKPGIFQQALIHALDIVHYPERVNQTYFRIYCELYPDHENRASKDKYCLDGVFMVPLDSIQAFWGQDYEGYRYWKYLDEHVKSRGQIGAILIKMVDDTNSISQWWPLAIPYTIRDAQKILEDTKWGNVWWASRLRDILEVPENSYEFVSEHAKLPDHLLRDTRMTVFGFMNYERFRNDPNCKFFDGDPRCDYTGRRIAFEEGNYASKLNEILTRLPLAKKWLE